MINEIILVKLTNDDQYIGTLTDEDNEGIRLENPLRIEVMYTSTTAKTPNVVVLPWNELSKMTNVYFDKLHVLYYTLPKDDIVDFYKKQVDIEEDLDNSSSDSEVIKALIEKMSSNTYIN
jgi:hypothetical protein